MPPAPPKKKDPLVSSFSSLSSAGNKSPPLKPASGQPPASGQSTSSTSKAATGEGERWDGKKGLASGAQQGSGKEGSSLQGKYR